MRRIAPRISSLSSLSSASLIAIALFVCGCRKSDATADKPVTSAVAPATPTAEAAPDGGEGSDASAGASYSGTYALAPASLHISDAKDYKNVKQAPDDPTTHVGEGTITIDVGADGRVTGTVDSGPASPGLIDGSIVDAEVRGVVRRKTPSDNGLTGTLVAKLAGDSVAGTLSLAESNAAILREGKLTLKKK